MTLTEIADAYKKINPNYSVPFSFGDRSRRNFMHLVDRDAVAVVEMWVDEDETVIFTIYNLGSKVMSSYQLPPELRETPSHMALRLYRLLQAAI